MAFLYVSPLFFSTLLGLMLVFIIAQNRPVPGSGPLAALVLGATLWSLGYALEILAPALETKLLWAKIQYFGIVTVPVAWYIFALRHLILPGWSFRSLKYRVILTGMPLLTLVLVWTNEWHNLVWRDLRLQATGPLQILDIEHGPWFWVFLLFSYSLFLVGSGKLLLNLRRSIRLRRWQIILVLLASLFPFLGNLVYITHLNPVQHVDWTPFSFTLSGVLFSLSLFRFRFVNILPIAQKTVFAGLADSLLILDKKNDIIDLNLAAETLIGQPGENLVGRSLEQFLPEIADWVGKAGTVKECQVEIVHGAEPDQRFYDLNISTLSGLFRRPIGRLLVLHEITQLIQEQARLEQARTRLEEIVAERTETLRQTVEQLQRGLIERSLVEKRFEEVVESAPDAILLVDQTGVIKLVNVQAERLFGYARAELVERNIDILIPENRRRSHRAHLLQYVARPKIRQISDTLDLIALRQDGSQFPAEISLGPLNKDGGVWVACNVRDVTERKKAEQERSQLLQEIQKSHEQLVALAFRLQEVRELERREIASELHDCVGQNLTGLSLNLHIVQNQLCENPSPVVRSRLADSLKLVEETTRKVRDVMADLHPPVLDEYGLVSALQWYSDNFSRRTGLDILVTGDPIELRLPLKVEIILFRLVQEALNNVAKHAQATLVEIIVESSEQFTSLTVRDDGLGFDLRALNAPTAQPHWGFIGMEQRAASIGGQLSINSAPGQGTCISVRVKRGEHED